MEWMKPDVLWWLIAIPILATFFIVILKRKREKAIQIWGKSFPAMKTYRWRFYMICLWMAGLAFIVLALANPRKGDQPIEEEVNQADIILAIDISRSMLATDIRPNRLSTAKNISLGLVRELAFDRIGSIVFAGNAYINMPLTSDLGTLPTFISNISVETAGTQGTAIGEAIELTYSSFARENAAGLQLVILSDGEDHEEGAIDHAKEASEMGMTIHTVGIGTPQGSLIPIQSRGATRYLRDKDNKEVVSTLKEGLLKKIAQETGGIYARYTSLDETVSAIAARIKDSAERKQTLLQYRSYTYYYKYALGIAFVFFLGAIFIQWLKL